jgi:archaellum component FlaC
VQKPSERPSQSRTVELPKELANASPAERYEAWQRIREALNNQVEMLNGERENLSQTLRQNTLNGTVDRGLAARMEALDARVANIHAQISHVDQELVQAAALAPARTTTVAETRVQQLPPGETFPEEVLAIPALLIICVGLPIAIAFARRIWRRGEIGAGVTKDMVERLNRMDQNIDAIALEVERIGESQRYLTKQTEKERANLKA